MPFQIRDRQHRIDDCRHVVDAMKPSHVILKYHDIDIGMTHGVAWRVGRAGGSNVDALQDANAQISDLQTQLAETNAVFGAETCLIWRHFRLKRPNICHDRLWTDKNSVVQNDDDVSIYTGAEGSKQGLAVYQQLSGAADEAGVTMEELVEKVGDDDTVVLLGS